MIRHPARIKIDKRKRRSHWPVVYALLVGLVLTLLAL